MKTAVKSIEPADMEEVYAETAALKMVVARLKGTRARVDVGHEMKFWEWARAYKAIEEVYGERRDIEVLDIGAAYSALGPTLAWFKRCRVTEAEPDSDCGFHRGLINEYFKTNDTPAINWVQAAHGNLESRLRQQYHAVLSISVLEHVEPHYERLAWAEMGDLVLPGGLLIVTMDCMPKAQKGYMFDDVRWTNYDMGMVQDRVALLERRGFEPLGAIDYGFHGVQVHDYSFAGLIMRKPE